MVRRALLMVVAVIAGYAAATPLPAGACSTDVGAPFPTSCPQAPSLAAYRGLAAWVDVYDTAQWNAPAATVDRMHSFGVRTLFLEVPFSGATATIGRGVEIGDFLAEAHALHMRAVAWWVPGFTNPALDVNRGLAAARFRAANGQRFNSLGVDIERSTVADVALRNHRVVNELALIRAGMGASYPISAIIPAPRGMQLAGGYWPVFPYVGIARSVNVFVPMGYYTYHTNTYAGAYDYTIRNAQIIRDALGRPHVPIHMIGGAAASTSLAALRGFVQATNDLGLRGASIYDYATTSGAEWPILAGVPG
jgi:hypothetical protein